eukprot:gene9301-6540_t
MGEELLLVLYQPQTKIVVCLRADLSLSIVLSRLRECVSVVCGCTCVSPARITWRHQSKRYRTGGQQGRQTCPPPLPLLLLKAIAIHLFTFLLPLFSSSRSNHFHCLSVPPQRQNQSPNYRR